MRTAISTGRNDIRHSFFKAYPRMVGRYLQTSEGDTDNLFGFIFY